MQFSEKYIVCDTCISTIIVHHEECTTCGEITVDSGNVYLSHDILEKCNTLANNPASARSGKFSPNYIFMHELYFSNKGYFNKLWKDKEFKDYDKAFRLTGKVVDVKRRVLGNGVVEIYPSLFFKVYKATEVDTAYLEKIRQE